MADDDANLVSNIEITGADQATADLTKLGDAGQDAFDKIAKSATDANAATGKAGDNISGALKDIDKAAPGPTVAQRITDIGTAAQGLGGHLADAGSSVARFGTTIVALASAGVAAIAGIAKFASSVTEAARGVVDNTDDLTRQQIQLNKQTVSAAGNAAQYSVSQQKLNRDLAAGKLTVTQYNDQLTDLKQSYKDQIAVQNEVDAAQQEMLKTNQKLQAQAAQREAYNALAKVYGTTLTNSLITLGAESDRVQQQLRDAFGPVLASLVDRVLAVIQNNSAAISSFIDRASASMAKFIDTNGPALTAIIAQIGTAAKGIVEGIVGVAIPALKSLIAALDQVAVAINAVFGTNINGTFLLMAATLLKVTGAFTAFFNVLKLGVALFRVAIPVVRLLVSSFTPWGAAITLVTLALSLLATSINWSAFAANAVTAGTSIATFFTSLPARISAAFTSLFATVQAAASAAANFIIQSWQAFLLFFTVTLPVAIGLVFTNLWTSIVTGVQVAVAGVVAAWQSFIAFFAGIPAQVVALLAAGWALVVSAVTTAVQTMQTLFTSFMTYLSSLPDQIIAIFTAIATSIANSFQNGLNSAYAAFVAFGTKVKAILQPILDLINQITGATAGSADGDQPAFAGGGHVGNGPVRGGGTSTSDSIFAWLSNNEFVMKAKAVRKYGIGFMNAINSGSFDLNRLLSNMGAFAAGGLVGTAATGGMGRGLVPALATSGPSGSGRTLNLTIGGETFAGLVVPESVADRLTTFAINKQAKSAGRRPSWVGGTR